MPSNSVISVSSIPKNNILNVLNIPNNSIILKSRKFKSAGGVGKIYVNLLNDLFNAIYKSVECIFVKCFAPVECHGDDRIATALR